MKISSTLVVIVSGNAKIYAKHILGLPQNLELKPKSTRIQVQSWFSSLTAAARKITSRACLVSAKICQFSWTMLRKKRASCGRKTSKNWGSASARLCGSTAEFNGLVHSQRPRLAQDESRLSAANCGPHKNARISAQSAAGCHSTGRLRLSTPPDGG